MPGNQDELEELDSELEESEDSEDRTPEADSEDEDNTPLTVGALKKLLASSAQTQQPQQAATASFDDDEEDESFDPKTIRSKAANQGASMAAKFIVHFDSAAKALRKEYAGYITEDDIDYIKNQFLEFPQGIDAATKLLAGGAHMKLANEIIGERVRTKKINVAKPKVDPKTKTSGGIKSRGTSRMVEDFNKYFGPSDDPKVKRALAQAARGGR